MATETTWPTRRTRCTVPGVCGRYTLSEEPSWSELRIRVPDELLVKPRFNASPGRDQLVVLREGEDGLQLAERHWGARVGKRLAINARMESLGWPTWRDHLARCVVPSDGFVEWRKTDTGKEPMWLRRPEGGGRLLWMAGIVVDDGFVIVTTPPSKDLDGIHDRMPAILPPKRVGAWLDAGWAEARGMLGPAPAGLLEAVPVSSRINSVSNDDAGCLVPDVAVRQFGLF